MRVRVPKKDTCGTSRNDGASSIAMRREKKDRIEGTFNFTTRRPSLMPFLITRAHFGRVTRVSAFKRVHFRYKTLFECALVYRLTGKNSFYKSEFPSSGVISATDRRMN